MEIAKPLSLVGVKRAGKNAAVVQPSNMVANTDLQGYPTAAAILVRDTSDVTIKNMTVDGINNGIVCDPTPPYIDGIFYRNASGTIESVVIRNMLTPQGCAYGDGLDVQATEGEWQLTVRDSSIHDYDSAGILSVGTGLSLSVIRNVVTGVGPSPGQGGIQLIDGATGSIEQNIVTNHVTAGCPECDFISTNIVVFEAKDVRIVGNTVSNSNVGMYVGGFNGFDSNRATVLDNRVSGARPYDGMIVIGDDNVVKGNSITDSDYMALYAEGANNTIQDNTINEAYFGILATTGNSIFHNQLFNTTRTVKVFSLEAPDEGASPTRVALTPSLVKNRPR